MTWTDGLCWMYWALDWSALMPATLTCWPASTATESLCIQRDARAFLWDVREAAQAIRSFTTGLDAKAYVSSELAQAAVECKFEVIGEALNPLTKLEVPLAARIPEVPQVVAFSNQLIHGYASINPDTFWNIVQSALPDLPSAVQALLDELGY